MVFLIPKYGFLDPKNGRFEPDFSFYYFFFRRHPRSVHV